MKSSLKLAQNFIRFWLVVSSANAAGSVALLRGAYQNYDVMVLYHTHLRMARIGCDVSMDYVPRGALGTL